MKTEFWNLVDRSGGDNGCWIWLGTINVSTGYGQFSEKARTVMAHRRSYELAVGPIPTRYHIDHLCRVTACVNPAHLEAVTEQVNIIRGTSPSALNAKKTHCIRGHELSGDNLYLRPAVRAKQTAPRLAQERICRTCAKIRDRAYLARQRAKAGL